MTARSDRTSEIAGARSPHVEVPKSVADKALEALLPATSKYTERLCEAVRSRSSGWHRLAIKVERGQIKSVQIILDEQIDPSLSGDDS